MLYCSRTTNRMHLITINYLLLFWFLFNSFWFWESPLEAKECPHEELHDDNLGNGEEAPNGWLFHWVIREVFAHQRTSSEENCTQKKLTEPWEQIVLNDQEWSEHEEHVNGCRCNEVA